MAKVYDAMTELVGKTPLVRFKRLENKYGLKAEIIAKIESFNPGGSAKDRVAAMIIEEAEKDGRLKPGGTIIEPTSGNTGIGLALVAAVKGYRLIIVIPDTMSIERRNIIKAYGAEIVLTDGKLGMSGAIEKAKELNSQIPGSIIAGQFDNPANPKAHYLATGPEIFEDTDGKVDYFVAGIGTGGTITGVGGYLKEQNPAIRIIGVEPETSAVITKGISGAHSIQGIGAGFIPSVLNMNVVDEVITVDNEECFEMAKEIARLEGIQVGISSGAAMCAAVKIALKNENNGKSIVVLLPDGGDRYYSTKLYTCTEE